MNLESGKERVYIYENDELRPIRHRCGNHAVRIRKYRLGGAIDGAVNAILYAAYCHCG